MLLSNLALTNASAILWKIAIRGHHPNLLGDKIGGGITRDLRRKEIKVKLSKDISALAIATSIPILHDAKGKVKTAKGRLNKATDYYTIPASQTNSTGHKTLSYTTREKKVPKKNWRKIAKI